MRFDGYMPVRIVSGRNCLSDSGDTMLRFGKTCLIVCSSSAAKKSGALDDCIAVLNSRGISYEVFDRIGQNPLTSTCHEAGIAARNIKADFIIGIGGGSPMDAAKAIAIYALNPDMGHTDIYKREVPSKALPVILIGTTAGTGSEVTGVSVLTNADSGMKKSISGPDCYAAVSFCDYGYTCSAPDSVTRSTALDAFAHAAESMLCSTSNALSETYARKALSLLSDYILAMPDPPADLSEPQREALYSASVFAGLAINITGTAFPHTVGYYLTERYGVPHGYACAAFLHALFIRAKKYCPERVGAIAACIGCETDDLCKKLTAAVDLGFRISPEEAASASGRWQGTVRNFARTPGGFSASDAAQVLAERTAR